MWRLALALALATPIAAAAADVPKAELFAGYSHARHDGLETDGFEAELDLSLGGSFGVEVSAARHYKSELGTSLSWTSLFAGPRYAWRRERVTPFVHVLGGVVRSSAGLDVFDVSIRETETDPGGAVGAGLDFAVGNRWAVRLQGDYVLRRSGSETEGDPRASIGVVFRAGRR
jgi:hypothetical protein